MDQAILTGRFCGDTDEKGKRRMEIASNTGFVPALTDYAHGIPMLRQAGFDCFDLSICCQIDTDGYFEGAEGETRAKEVRRIADACGMVCNQSHAPYPTSYRDDTPEHMEMNRVLPEKLRRAMEIAAIVGAKAIVVHPQQHLRWADCAAELKEQNLAFYESLLPLCRAYNIRVAVENMWQRNRFGRSIVDSVCSTPREFLDYMEMLDSEWFVACLDIGHCTVTNHRPEDLIRTLGKKHLHVLHIHDTDGKADLHTLPFQSTATDWEAVTDALAEIGYEGELTLEADNFHGRIPAGLLQPTLNYMASVARYLADATERKKQALKDAGVGQREGSGL